MNVLQIAESFSQHRFTDTFDHHSADVRWVLPGHEPVEGKDAVVAACTSSANEMAQLTSAEFSRFVSVAGERVAAIDAVGRYVSPNGDVSVVSSADIYEFDTDGLLSIITSYAVELDT